MENTMKKFIFLGLAALLTGCLTYTDGGSTFSISGKKMLLGPSLADASAKIPSGAKVLHVGHTSSLFGLVQITYIAGTK